MKKLTLIFAFLFANIAFAQSYPQLTNQVQIRPQAIPTSPTTVISQDAYICYADFTATGQTINISDKQATPVVWINNTLGSGGSATTWIFNAFGTTDAPGCRWMPGGFTIQAGGSGVTGYLIIKCPSRCVLNWGF